MNNNETIFCFVLHYIDLFDIMMSRATESRRVFTNKVALLERQYAERTTLNDASVVKMTTLGAEDLETDGSMFILSTSASHSVPMTITTTSVTAPLSRSRSPFLDSLLPHDESTLLASELFLGKEDRCAK